MTTPIAAATIAQQAFRYIGASTPSSFADDSEETRAATEQFPAAIRECLELRDWRFASSLLRLAKTTPTAPEWTADADLPHAYRLPDGVLVARAIQPRGARWRRDGDYLRCDQDEGVTLRATMLRTDEKNLPAAFRDLVALTLALQLAPRFARDASRITMIGEQRETALASAIAADQGQATPGPWLGADLASSQIVQQAFRYVIGSEAGRFGDDAEEARAASQLYPQALDQCLAEEDWPFASATSELAEDADPAATVTGWRDDPSLPHAYALPDDALTPRAVRPRGTRWRREGPFIRADRASAIDLRFTRRFTAADEDELPAAIRDYAALTLAKLLAPRFAASAEVAQLLAEKLAEARAYAIKTEAPQRSAGPFLSETLEGSEIAQQAWAHIEAGEDARPDDDGEKARATDRLYRRAVRACRLAQLRPEGRASILGRKAGEGAPAPIPHGDPVAGVIHLPVQRRRLAHRPGEAVRIERHGLEPERLALGLGRLPPQPPAFIGPLTLAHARRHGLDVVERTGFRLRLGGTSLHAVLAMRIITARSTARSAAAMPGTPSTDAGGRFIQATISSRRQRSGQTARCWIGSGKRSSSTRAGPINRIPRN